MLKVVLMACVKYNLTFVAKKRIRLINSIIHMHLYKILYVFCSASCSGPYIGWHSSIFDRLQSFDLDCIVMVIIQLNP